MNNIPIISSVNQQDVTVLSIEGCNGAGKTTILNTYATFHPDTECRLCVPNIYQQSREMKHYMLFNASPLCGALYYLAGSIEVRETHDSNYSKILLDRSVWSTFAAAYAKDEKVLPYLFSCLEIVKNKVLLPDFVVVLDASYETCRYRSSKKNVGGEFDLDAKDSHERKMDFYRLLGDSGYPICFLDVNDLDPNEAYLAFESIADKVFG